MNLSLAITTFNRIELTIESFAQVIDDPRIDDIVLLDDASTDGSFEKLVEYFKGNEKVRVIRQAQNRGMSLNKRDAIALSQNEWVAILDSDNVFDASYFDALFNDENVKSFGLQKNTICCPAFAKPQFNYTPYQGDAYFLKKVAINIKNPVFNCLMNTANYIVNRNEYLKVYEYNSEMKGTDTVWFNYLWLKAGNCFYVVPGMEYQHLVHAGSGFMQDVDYNMNQSEKIKKMIMAL